MSITTDIRRKIVDVLLGQSIPFYGKMDLVEFLSKIWDLKKMPSKDKRYDDAESDIYQHMINNSDWTEAELLKNYFELLTCPEKIFIDFLELSIHPELDLDKDSFNERLNKYSQLLEYDDYTINVTNFVAGTPKYSVVKLEEVEEMGIPFYTVEWKEKLPANAVYPCIQLMKDNWNDFGYSTLFRVIFYNSKHKKNGLGDVKILQKDNTSTQLPSAFFRLDSSYCSLGQTIDYYNEISKLEGSLRLQILGSLNDVVSNSSVYEKFVNEQGFKESLLRYSEAEKAFNEGKEYLVFNQDNIEKNLSFTFSFQVGQANKPHIIDFDFKENKYLPFQINTLIGKNGTGKTKILAQLAQLISGNLPHENNFMPARPSFSKVIAISYSIFDEFYKPDKENEKYGSYKYCGVRNRQGYLDLNSLVTDINRSKSKIIKLNRTDFWKDVLKDIMEDDSIFELDTKLTVDNLSNYSSGQNMVFATMTHVIANIQHDSLVLVDEPETHLHPNAIAKVIRALYKLLKMFKSYAIIATHSPLIAQEVPSRYVRIIERIENVPSVRKPGIECFGENLTVITNDIFYRGPNQSIYQESFYKLVQSLTYDEILEVFNNKLSFNAKMIIKALNSEGHSDEKSKPVRR